MPVHRPLWPWLVGLGVLAILAVLVYGFWPVSIPLTPVGTVRSAQIRSAWRGEPNWMMAVAADSEAFDDYGIRPPTQADFSRCNVVISHGRPLQRLTYQRFSRFVARYRYWINRPLGRPRYKGSFVPDELYLYLTADKTFVWWGTP